MSPAKRSGKSRMSLSDSTRPFTASTRFFSPRTEIHWLRRMLEREDVRGALHLN